MPTAEETRASMQTTTQTTTQTTRIGPAGVVKTSTTQTTTVGPSITTGLSRERQRRIEAMTRAKILARRAKMAAAARLAAQREAERLRQIQMSSLRVVRQTSTTAGRVTKWDLLRQQQVVNRARMMALLQKKGPGIAPEAIQAVMGGPAGVVRQTRTTVQTTFSSR